MEDPGSINEVRGWRRLVVWLLAKLLIVWGRTLRLEVDAETYARLTDSDQPAAIVLWHNRLFLSAEIFRRYRFKRRIHGLVSASKDGAWLAAFYRMIGLIPVRGSSSQHGREAARALIEKMREGHDIGITPDGPRGPVYVLEPGVLVVARRSNAPMMLVGAQFGPALRLRSWDRFYIPWPFTRIRMRCTVLPPRGPDGDKLNAERVGAELRAINPD
ncbi:MAG TPA: lysophospholipid acyltransferase family protein [Lacunisphaera sp.]|nr:lysophospholipid acyltransferase family protein [Lacunisphaera sp.]